MIFKLIDKLEGIDIVEFENGLNIWFNPDYYETSHEAFWDKVNELDIPCEYMGIDEVNGRHGDCYFFPF